MFGSDGSFLDYDWRLVFHGRHCLAVACYPGHYFDGVDNIDIKGRSEGGIELRQLLTGGGGVLGGRARRCEYWQYEPGIFHFVGGGVVGVDAILRFCSAMRSATC